MRGFAFEIYTYLINPVIGLLFWAAIAYVIIGWLFAGGIIPSHNMTMRNIWSALHNLFDPMLRPLRRFVPTVGNIDFSLLVFPSPDPFCAALYNPKIHKPFARLAARKLTRYDRHTS